MKFLRSLGLPLVLYVVLPLVFLEIVIRLLGMADHLYTDGGAYESSSAGDYWQYRPGFTGTVLGPTQVRIGPYGSRLHGVPGREAEVNVAIFGDSFTFGQGVADEDTFPARLERSLLNAGMSAGVLNFGVAGHSLEMEVAHLAERMEVVHPQIVILAFPSMDLDPRRARNRVDRFGYLTKDDFGSSSGWMDWIRAALRHSHLALLAKHAFVKIRLQSDSSATSATAAEERLERQVDRFRQVMTQFEQLTRGVRRIVVCLDMRESALSRVIHRVMLEDFPQLTYVHAPPAFEGLNLDEMRVPHDGHPNAAAQGVYAELIRAPLNAAVRGVTADPSAEQRNHTPPGG